MADFQFYVTDDRYGVRTVMLVDMKDLTSVRDLAERLHRGNAHYRMVEAYDGDDLLFTVGAEAAAEPTQLHC